MRIFPIINELPPKTFNSFRLFLQSPFHNSNKRLVKMLEVRGSKSFEPEGLHQQLFPEEPFNKQVFKNLASLMLKKYKSFLAITLVESNEDLREALTYRKVKEDGLEKQLSVNLAPLPSYDFLSQSLLSFQLRGELANSYLQTIFENKKSLGGANEMIKKEFLLHTTNFLVSKIKFFCNYLFFTKRYPELVHIDFIEKELSSFEIPNYLSDSKLLELYNYSFRLVKDATLENYNQLEGLFKANIEKIHTDHFRFILGILSNYCIHKLNAGEAKFNQNVFELSEINLRHNTQKNFPYQMVSNYAVAGCRIGKMREVKDFLLTHKKKMTNNTYYYNMGLVKNYSKNYSDSLEHLHHVKFDGFHFTLNTRHLIIRNLVALNEVEVALDNIESLKIFLQRSKNVYAVRKRNNLNFLKYLKACILTKSKKELLHAHKYQKAVEELTNKIIQQKNLFTKEYLIEYLQS